MNFFKFLFFLSIGLGILYWVYLKQNAAYLEQCRLDGKTAAACGTLVTKVINDFKQVNYWWILLVLMCFMLSNISRAARWNMLLKPLGYVPKFINSFFTVMLGYFANLALPRIGEVVRAGSLSNYEKIPLDNCVGTVVTDRIMDVISLLIVVGLTFLLEFNTLKEYLVSQMDIYGKIQGLIQNPIIWVLGGLFLLGAILSFVFKDKLMQSKLVQKVVNFAIGIKEGILSIGKLERPGLFILHSINIWLMYYLMTYICFFAFAPTADLGALPALMVFVFGAFGIVIPSPGGLGTFHFLVVQALAIYSIGEDNAFSFAMILFLSIQIFCNIFFGLLALLFLPRINRNYEPQIMNNTNNQNPVSQSVRTN